MESPMHRGYIKLWRKTKYSRVASEGLNVFGFFCWLLISANHKKAWFMGVEIHPGQIATSYGSLSDQTGSSIKVVRNMLDKLTEFKMIKRENRANRFTILSICNWETYQNVEDEAGQTEGTTEGTTEGKPRANRGQTKGNNQRIKKNYDNNKNENNDKKIDFVCPGHLKEVFPLFIEMRKKIKKPLTKHAKFLIIRKLNRITSNHDEQIEILNNSIESSWQGVFPIKSEKQPFGKEEPTMQELRDQAERVDLNW